MKAFADLYTALDETTGTNQKVGALRHYFAHAAPADAAWALYFLIGRKPKQLLSVRKLREWVQETIAIPDWLLGECYDAVGDFAETVALLLPDTEHMATDASQSLRYWVEERLLALRDADEATQRTILLDAWGQLNSQQRFVWNKLITGSFRVGVSQQLVTRALAQVSGVDTAVIAHRLMGAWEPTADFYTRLLAPDTQDSDSSRPYPFFLAYPHEGDPASLGDVQMWQAEWKWDGIRAQLIRRAGQTFLWSRGEELITERFPEISAVGNFLPDGTVIDGEILPWKEGVVLPFAQLQRRIGRKTLGKKILSEVPVILLAYDLLERHGQDVRSHTLQWRREQLAEMIAAYAAQLGSDQPVSLQLSTLVAADTWDELAAARLQSREHRAEGLMLKRLDSPYRVGRQRGDWWKWKIDPFTIDAVIIYAQRGSGKRASLYTDYTFGVWDNDRLVPFAKAYSGLTDAEIRRVDAFVRQNTVEKFGPVRTVTPALVFELAFEGIQRSARHKSGIAVRFPRILRWRHDKPIEEADSLATIHTMLPGG